MDPTQANNRVLDKACSHGESGRAPSRATDGVAHFHWAVVGPLVHRFPGDGELTTQIAAVVFDCRLALPARGT